MKSQSPPQRRGIDRIPAYHCKACLAQTVVQAVCRTDYVVYFRCGECGNVFSVPKPKRRLSS